MTKVFSEEGLLRKKEILLCIAAFKTGQTLFSGKRNTIKTFDIPDLKLNIKTFKKPNIFNKIVYRFFRKSKAQRSFEYALFLLKKGLGTPKPFAYLQDDSSIFFGKSYYVSEHLEADFTFRDIIHDSTIPNRSEILRQFTNFTYRLHENGIEFLDHTPGNTLINFDGNHQYSFYLVDLNRMKFHKTMSYETRIKNFSKLTPQKEMVAEMSAEYAKLIGKEYEKVFSDMWHFTEKFQQKFHRKRQLKKKLKFWKH